MLSFIKNFKSIFCAFIFLQVPLTAEIIESQSLKDISRYADKNSLVLLNISDTLYQPSTTLAEGRWRTYFAKQVDKVAGQSEAALQLIDQTKNLIVTTIPKVPVELAAPAMINALQSNKIPVLGITQKSPSTSYAQNFGEVTYKHLLCIGIDLEKTLSFYKVNETNDSTHDFAYGMIFTHKQPEGPAVISFLKRVPQQPATIIMIDNSRKSLESVESSLTSTGIHFVGLRYGKCDSRIENFDPELGTIEFFALLNENKIITDAEALKIKKRQPEVDYEAKLNEYIARKLNLSRF